MDNFDGQIIKLTKWEKYNLRKDVKQHSWFRLQNDLFEDHEFFDFTHAEVLFWVYLLSLASKKQDPEIRFNQAHAERIGRFKPSEIASALQKLEQIGAVQVTLRVRNVDVTEHVRVTLQARTDDFTDTLRARTDDFTDTLRARTPDQNGRVRHITEHYITEHNITEEEELKAVAIAPAHPENLPEEIKPRPPVGRKNLTHPEIGRFIGAYVKAYQDAYPPKGEGPKPRPDLRGKVQGQINNYLADVPIDRACDLIQAYCQMEDAWFQTKCHDFGTFLENQNKVSLALDRGEEANSIDWSQVFAGERLK